MDFLDFLEHEEEVVRRTATVLQELTESYERNALTLSEYQDLVNDLMNIDNIDEINDTTKNKATIQEAFTALLSLVKT